MEATWFPGMKGGRTAILAGLALVVVGQFFRAAAMWTAKASFTHIIADSKREEHVLVTNGVYR